MAALGMDTEGAMTAALSTSLALRCRFGLVIADNEVPLPSRELAYPAGAQIPCSSVSHSSVADSSSPMHCAPSGMYTTVHPST